MKLKSAALSLFSLLCVSTVFAEEIPATTNKPDETKEIGMDQKLKSAYDLYRRGDAVSLKPSETMLGLGLSYSLNDKNTLGYRESSRIIGMQAFASHGLGHGMELSVSAPFAFQTQQTETTGSIHGKTSVAGFGDPTIRLMGTLPTKDFTTTAYLSASLPFGNDLLSRGGAYTSLGINFNKVLRPAFVSGGLSWDHDWKSGVEGVGYNIGGGFFLNHELSIGGGLNGVVMINPKPGFAHDLAAFSIKAAYQATPDFGVVGSVNFGLTADTPQTVVGINAYWKF